MIDTCWINRRPCRQWLLFHDWLINFNLNCFTFVLFLLFLLYSSSIK
uniref:Uncharacterized protein n=1 Tax=Anguilla anguilla TaxID=7936 RepID=A0A0E9R9P0_ANGAN